MRITTPIKLTTLAAAAAAVLPSLLGVSGANAAGPNLLNNPDFDGGVGGWAYVAPYPQGSIAPAGDGTAIVTNWSNLNTATFGGVGQCVNNVLPNTEYTAAADMFTASGQDRRGGAVIRVYWYDNSNCTGQVLAAPIGPHLGDGANEKDQWLYGSYNPVSPAGTVSARMFIMAEKEKPENGENANDPFSVRFDNVFFGLKNAPVIEVPLDDSWICNEFPNLPECNEDEPEYPPLDEPNCLENPNLPQCDEEEVPPVDEVPFCQAHPQDDQCDGDNDGPSYEPTPEPTPPAPQPTPQPQPTPAPQQPQQQPTPQPTPEQPAPETTPEQPETGSPLPPDTGTGTAGFGSRTLGQVEMAAITFAVFLGLVAGAVVSRKR